MVLRNNYSTIIILLNDGGNRQNLVQNTIQKKFLQMIKPFSTLQPNGLFTLSKSRREHDKDQ